jgi:hypothetical protein
VETATSELVDEDGKTSKEEADRRRAVANAITAEVEVDEALKSVVSRFDAESAIADFCQALRAGAKIAGRAATMTKPGEIRDLCEAECNAHRTQSDGSRHRGRRPGDTVGANHDYAGSRRQGRRGGDYRGFTPTSRIRLWITRFCGFVLPVSV